MTSAEEQETIERFGEQYRAEGTDLSRRIEQAVIGSDWGANGYTTVAQADLLGRLLRLGPGTRLLDLGAGRGWPGLYLASRTRCEVVLSDLPIDGLRAARTRAGHEGLSGHASVVVASARRPPFRPATFDAVVHTDVFC